MSHIAVFLPSLRGGGAERVMVQLANGFAARGHRVDLVLVAAQGPYLAEVSPKVRVVDLGRRRLRAGLWPLMLYLWRARPTALLSALPHANLVALWARALTGLRLRLVVSERNSLEGLELDRQGRRLLRWMARFYPKADAVVAVSRGIARELVDEIGLKTRQVRAIPNPVDLALIRAGQAAPLPHPWLAEGEAPVVLAVGRLEAQKDYSTLLAAFALLRARVSARLIILGEGSQRGALAAEIAALGLEQVVALPGFDPNPYAFMARARVFVLSSRVEGFPNVLVQALACGVRAVSTDCPTGPAEILEGGRWGRLVPVGDAAGLAAALEAALTDKASPAPEARAG